MTTDLLKKMEDFAQNNVEVDQEDAPDWVFEDRDEVKSKDPTYEFCPAVYRLQILRLFTKHFCLHPLFPECNGSLT